MFVSRKLARVLRGSEALEVAASPGKSLFGKALSCAVSVLKAGRVQDGAATSCVRREISVFIGYEPVGNRFVTFLFECKF